MTSWESLDSHYTQKLELTIEERGNLPAQATAYFATLAHEKRVIFVQWNSQVLWSYTGETWNFLDDNTPVTLELFSVPYPNRSDIDSLDPVKGTA